MLKAPFPWFGGKSLVAEEVWARFGDVGNYVEPFFGSGAVLLNRPEVKGSEIVNDKDGYVANLWRAIARNPDAVAHYADWPVNENDLHARHSWLLEQKKDFVPRLEGDPDFFDSKIAGYWVWGICCWIGSGFCSGTGPWVVREIESEKGVNRKLVHLSGEKGVNRKRVNISGKKGGVGETREELIAWMRQLAERLRNVRVCSGDWSRIMGPSPTWKQGLTAVFLDPPYSAEAERAEVYTVEDLTVAHAVREWAIANGSNPLLRIALCGYEGEHEMPADWSIHEWKANGGYEGQAKGERSGNSKRERIWFSPACLSTQQPNLFAESGK